mgnify:CR=1 FL=1
MTAHLLASIWIASNFYCMHLLKTRQLKIGFILGMIGLLLGPLAIPMILLAAHVKKTKST